MILNNMEFCRVFAFVECLRIMNEGTVDRGLTVHPLDDKTKVLGPEGKMIARQTLAIKQLQKFTVDKGTQFAKYFPDVSFPDETEPETQPINRDDERDTSRDFSDVDDSKAGRFVASDDFSGRSIGATVRPGVLLGRERKARHGDCVGIDRDSNSGQ